MNPAGKTTFPPLQRGTTTTDRHGTVVGVRDEEGQGLVELLISMLILSVGVAALLSLMAAGAVSLQRSDQRGTALTLAENQMELYRGVAYPYIRLSATQLGSVPVGIRLPHRALERRLYSTRFRGQPGTGHHERQPSVHGRRRDRLCAGPNRDRAGSPELRDRHLRHSMPRRRHHLVPGLVGSHKTGVRRRTRPG